METKTSKKGTENRNSQAEYEWYNSSAAALTDIYKKQVDLAFGFYKNVFNSFWNLNARNWGANFFQMGKSNLFPFSPLNNGETQNPVFAMYQSMFKQMSEYNQYWLDVIRQNNPYNISIAEINDSYQNLLNSQWESSKKIMDEFTKAYNDQLDISTELNRKLYSEMSKVMKNNEAFWSDILKTFDIPLTKEMEKHERDIKQAA